jgi:hypothetical protein
MPIEKIANPHKERSEQPDEIWANTELDALRRTGCLCLNCERTRNAIDPTYTPCPIAKQLYELCITNDLAIAITRCGATDKKTGTLLYVPREK